MAKRVFTAFAVEDKSLRTMLVGQRLHTDTPFEWTDISVSSVKLISSVGLRLSFAAIGFIFYPIK